ncbi:MAG: hypothetical protein FRX49_12650 [Trebouxia sp. A1-2]|nr:MAG: hypothetical protein FRX49_12650 [Trebouxia sp. A1-2]
MTGPQYELGTSTANRYMLSLPGYCMSLADAPAGPEMVKSVVLSVTTGSEKVGRCYAANPEAGWGEATSLDWAVELDLRCEVDCPCGAVGRCRASRHTGVCGCEGDCGCGLREGVGGGVAGVTTGLGDGLAATVGDDVGLLLATVATGVSEATAVVTGLAVVPGDVTVLLTGVAVGVAIAAGEAVVCLGSQWGGVGEVGSDCLCSPTFCSSAGVAVGVAVAAKD